MSIGLKSSFSSLLLVNINLLPGLRATLPGIMLNGRPGRGVWMNGMLKSEATSPSIGADKLSLVLVLMEELRVAVRVLEGFTVTPAPCFTFKLSDTFRISKCELPALGSEKNCDGSVTGFVMLSLTGGS